MSPCPVVAVVVAVCGCAPVCSIACICSQLVVASVFSCCAPPGCRSVPFARHCARQASYGPMLQRATWPHAYSHGVNCCCCGCAYAGDCCCCGCEPDVADPKAATTAAMTMTTRTPSMV